MTRLIKISDEEAESPSNEFEKNFHAGYTALNLDSYISQSEADAEGLLKSDEFSPEECAIKKDTFLSLSEEARYVINLVISAPEELLTLTNGEVGITKLRKYLKDNGWSHRKIFSTIQEVCTFTNRI